MSGPDDTPTPSVEDQLDALQRESDLRRAELRELAARLPAAMSRRAILRAVAVDIRRAPEKGDIAARALRKVGRAPRRAGRALKRLVVPSAR